MMNYSSIRILLFSLSCGFITFAFQNCGGPTHLTGTEAADLASKETPLEYPYVSKPDFYIDTMVIKEADDVPTLTNYKVAVTLAHFELPKETTTYLIRLKNSEGLTLCPTQSGTLAPNKSLIKFECVGMADTIAIQLEVEASNTAGTKNFSFWY